MLNNSLNKHYKVLIQCVFLTALQSDKISENKCDTTDTESPSDTLLTRIA